MIKTWQERKAFSNGQWPDDDCMKDEIDELRAENAALKNQEPVDWQVMILGNRWTHCAKHLYRPNNEAFRALYLAPGAQPVKEGYQAAMAACVEFVRKCESGEAKSYASYTQMKKAIAMLEAAKEAS
jgi:hypothetical protein